jgi:hypothetical protein
MTDQDPEPTRRFSIETLLFALAFGLAVLLRLLRLGDLPLSDHEAAAALQAWQAAQGLHPVLGAQSGYVTLTAAIFYLFGSNEFLARLVPAVAGSLLVLVPWILRERLPGRSALYLAFIFAIGPGLLALSRTAGGAMMAVSFSLLAIAFWLTRRAYWAGASAGLALLSGPMLIPGLLGLGLAVLMNGGRFWEKPGGPDRDVRGDALRATSVAAGVFIFVGSLLFLEPRGLGAAFSAIPAYLGGWVAAQQVPLSRVLVAFFVYQPLGIIFGLVGLVYGISGRSRFAAGLGFWLLAALTLALVYPARQVADLAWALIPLWTLAALGLDRTLDFSRENPWETVGLTVLTVTLLGFAYLNFLALAMATTPPEDAGLRWGFTAGTIVMLAVVIALVALGWSARIARRGAIWGIVIALGLYTVSAAMGAAGLKAVTENELWRDSPAVVDADILTQTLNQLSDTTRGAVQALPVTVYGVDSSALMWVLREWNPQQSEQLPTGSDAPIIIGPDQPNVTFGAAYRGEGFTLRAAPDWDSASLGEWLRWLASREIPAEQDKIILWARTDLFPGGAPASP